MLWKRNHFKTYILLHPAYSVDLLLTDYHFFTHPDHFLTNKNFSNQDQAEEIFKEFNGSLNEEFFKKRIDI